MNKVVLAYSGGLDTSVAVAWLKEQYGVEVVTLTVDLGGGSLRPGGEGRAMSSGASRAYVVDGRERFVTDFVWPHLRVNCDPPFPVSLIYPPRSMRKQVAPKLPSGELVEGLRALGDDTRLRVLALIAERPRSTQELAPLLGLSEAAVSKHLRILAEAGVLSAKRDGYYVLYSLERERLAALSSTVLAFLDGDGTSAR